MDDLSSKDSQNFQNDRSKNQEKNIFTYLFEKLATFFKNIILLIEEKNNNFIELQGIEFQKKIDRNEICQKQCIPRIMYKVFGSELNSTQTQFQENYQFQDFKLMNNDQKINQNLEDYIKVLQKEEICQDFQNQQFINESTGAIIKLSQTALQKNLSTLYFQVFKSENEIVLKIRKSLSLKVSNKPQKQVTKQISFSDQNNSFQKFNLFMNEENEKSNYQSQFEQNVDIQGSIQQSVNDNYQLKQNQELLQKDGILINLQEEEQSESISSKEEKKETKISKIYIQKMESAKSLKNVFHQSIDQEPQVQKQKTVKDQLYQRKKVFKKNFSFGSSDLNEDFQDSKQIKKQQSREFNQEIINLEEEEKQQSSSKSGSQNNSQQKIEDSCQSEKSNGDSLEIKKNSQNLGNLLNTENKQDEDKNLIFSVKPTFSGISQSVLNSQIQNVSIVNQTQSKRRFLKKSKSQIDPVNQIRQQLQKKQSQLQILFNILPQGKLQKNLQNELEQIDESKNRDILSSLTARNINQPKSVESVLRNNLDSSESIKMQKKKKGKKNKKKNQREIILILKQLIDHYEIKLEQKQTALQFFKQKVHDLEFNLDSNKIFLNMVVHDMRNPTNQVEFMVTETLSLLKHLKIQIREKFDRILAIKNQPNQEQMMHGQILENRQNDHIAGNNEGRQIIIQIEEEKEQHFRINSKDQIIHQSFGNQSLQLNNQIPQQSISILLGNQYDQQVSNQLNKMEIQQEDQMQAEIAISQNQINKLTFLEKYEKFIKRMSNIAKIQNEDRSLEFKLKTNHNRSCDHKLKKDFPMIKIKKHSSPQPNKQRQIIRKLKKSENFFRGINRQNNVIRESIYTVQTIKNQVDYIEIQKNQFYNQFNFLKEKQLPSNQIQEQNAYQNQVVSQAFGIISKVKENFFQIQRKSSSNFLEQEPKIIKKKLKNLHISYDPKLLENKKPLDNLIKLETNLTIYEIQIEKKVKEEENTNILFQNEQNMKVEMESDLKFLEDLIQNLESSTNSLQNCKYCSVMLLNLINDMMDLAKTEKMKFELNCEFFDLTKTIQRAFESLSYFGDQKNIKPQLIVDPQIEQFFKNLNGDETRYSQIFLNFISNAFKFTPQNGNITIELCQADDQIFFQKKVNKNQIRLQSEDVQNINESNQDQLEDNNQIQEVNNQNDFQIQENKEEDGFQEYYISFQMRIKDSGMGISKENINKLFLNFGKLADPSGCNKTGTGLGLSICKHLIEKMGGKVKVESEGEGKGTTFIIKMQGISKVDFQVENLLLNLNQQSVFRNQSSIISKDVSEIIKEQKEALKDLQIETHKDELIVMMDQLSPGAKQSLQENFYGNPQKNQSQSFYEESKFELIRIPQSEIIFRAYQDPSLGLADAIKSLKALIVNDEFFILQMLTMMVKKGNIADIDTAQNGFDAFNMVLKKQYDFIICDLNMPVMDGFECVQKIRKYYNNSNSFFQKKSSLEDHFCPYLVACSAYIDKQTEEKALQAGFELVVQSPLTFQTLKDKIIVMSLEKKTLVKQNSLKKSSMILQENQSPLKQYEQNEDINQQNKLKELIDKLENKIRDEEQFESQKILLESLNEIDLKSSVHSLQIQKESENEMSNRQSFGVNQKEDGLSSISENSEISIEIVNEQKNIDAQKDKNIIKTNKIKNKGADNQIKKESQISKKSFEQSLNNSMNNIIRPSNNMNNIQSLMMNIGQNDHSIHFNKMSDSFSESKQNIISSQVSQNQQLISFQNNKIDSKPSLKYSNNNFAFEQIESQIESSQQKSVGFHSPHFSQQLNKVEIKQIQLKKNSIENFADQNKSN